MKTLLLTMALAGMVLPLVGCETYTDTAAENRVRVRHAMRMDLNGVPNDAEYIMYLDRPVWLTRDPIPND